ncbi:MAG: hypothetical protein ACTSQ8_05195 [Candidatus Helarchaeota archaeon]
MAKTRKKELVFHLSNATKRTQFLEMVQKKVRNLINLHIIQKHEKTRLIISGTHESVRYAIQLIRKIYDIIEEKGQES